jgi:hypothetical protein
MEFIISETNDVLVSRTGLAWAGALLQRTELHQRLDAMKVEGLKRPAMPHGEVLLSMIGLLCLGKSDYAAIEPFRRESFFARSLGLSRLPSEETLRQRMDQLGTVALAEDRRLPPSQKMPLSQPVTRRRLRSVIQHLMYLAVRLIRHARRFGRRLWCDDPWRFVWQRLYHRFTRSAAAGIGCSP